MKKVILLLLICCVLAGSLGTVYAAESNGEEDNTSLLDLLRERREEIVGDVLNPELFTESMDGVDLTKPMAKVYIGYYWDWMDGRSVDEVFAQADARPDRHFSWFALFNEESTEETMLLVRYRQDESIIYAVEIEENLQRLFIKEIQMGMTRQVFQNKECTILDVHIYTEYQFGTTFIFETDAGDYVRFYDSFAPKHLQPLELSWEEFGEYAYAWYLQERQLPPYKYGGSYGTFTEYVEACQAQKAAEAAQRQKTILLASGGGVAVLGAATAAVLLLRRRKNHQSTEE